MNAFSEDTYEFGTISAVTTESLAHRLDTLEETAKGLIRGVSAESLQGHLRLALRDVEEARLWMKVRDFEKRPHVVAIVTTAANFAQARIEYVQSVVAAYGWDGEEYP